MQVDEELVRRIARLARIKLERDEVERLSGELSGILNFVEQLSELDTDGVEPMTSAVPTRLKQREDEVTDGHYPDRILANAPQSEEHYFVVPTVVE